MFKKGVLGFAIFAAGLLVWSCGDGSVDSLSDTELLMISRFPSTIDYDMLDSIVEACKKDAACWEKAKKTGEIYKGDYTEVLRDSSGNIVVVEGDSAYVWKDGKKLPVFNFSSNSNDDDDEDVTSSGSIATSGSSSKRSSASGYDVDEYTTDGGDGADSNGSGSGGTSVAHDRSSSSKKSTSSSSVDLSFLNSSSSSLGVASSSSIKNERSSSSKIVISQSSVSQSSSSQQEVHLSSSSVTQHGGGGGGTGMTCDEGSLSGSCTVSENPGYRNETVTYTFKPDENNTCTAYGEVEWNVTNPEDGASVTHWADPTSSSRSSFSFDVKYSSIGDKKSVIFSMGGQNKQCDAVTIKRRCESNTYTCTRTLLSATDNLWKNDVKYKWEFSYSGCLENVSYTWQGALSGSTGASVTKTYTGTTPINQSVSLSVKDELHGVNEVGSDTTITCDPVYAVYEPDLPPTCAVANINAGTGLNVAVTPSTVTGCAYDNSKCSYSLTLKDDDNVIVSSPNGYGGETLTRFAGSSTDGETLTYTLTLKNYLGGDGGSCNFDVTYYDEVPVTATTTFLNYSAGGTYSVTVGNTTQNGFFCKSSINTNQGVVIGTFGEKTMKMNGYNPVSVTAGGTYKFEVLDTAPADLKCGIAYN